MHSFWMYVLIMAKCICYQNLENSESDSDSNNEKESDIDNDDE